MLQVDATVRKSGLLRLDLDLTSVWSCKRLRACDT